MSFEETIVKCINKIKNFKFELTHALIIFINNSIITRSIKIEVNVLFLLIQIYVYTALILYEKKKNKKTKKY